MTSDSVETNDIGLGNRPLPWWTWILPLFISNIGTWLSIWFKADPGTSLWYLPTSLGIVMVYWWGPRALLGLYLNAILCTPLWGLPWQWSPLYALPETIEVGLSWILFVRFAQGQYWLPNLRNVIQFLLLGSIVPAFIANFYLTTQLLLLGNIAPATFWDNWLILFSADLATHLVLAVPALLLLTHFMTKKGWTRIEGNITKLPLLPENRNSGYDIIFITLIFSSILIITILFSIHDFWILYGFLMIVLALRYGVNMAVIGASWTGILVFLLPPILTGRLGVPTVVHADFFTVNLEILFLCAVSLLTGRAISDLHSEIIERKQAEQALNRYANRLEVLHEIDRAILAARSPEEIAQPALRYLRQLVPCRRAGFNLLDFETNEIVILAIDVEYVTRLKAGNRLPFKGIQRIIDELRQGKVFVLTDIRSLPGGDILLEEGIRTGICLPLIANKALIGLVNLWSANSDPFSEEQVNISREVADQLAIAIQQARLFEAEAKRRQEAEALRDTAAALNSTLNLEEVLDRILSNVGRLVQHNMVNIALIEAGLTHVVRAQGYAEQGRAEAVMKSQHSLADTPLIRRMVETGHPVVIPDTQTHPDWVVKDESWLRSYAGIPIRLQGEVIGILNLDSDTPGVFKTADAERLQAFADQAAVAIKNAHLYAEAKQRAEHLAVLHELDQAITASLDADHVYQAFAQQTLRLLPYNFMSINLVEGDNLCLTYAAGEEPLAPVGSRLPLKALEMSRWVIEQGQPFLSTNLVSEQRFAAYQPVITMGMRSAMMLPLRVKGQVIGVWFLACRQVEGYSSHDLAIAQSVAEQLAIAVENARLFEQVQRYTEELEQRVADRTRELSALYDVTAVASESLDLMITLERSLERVLGAMRSQAGTIHLLDETGATLHLAVQQGLPPDLAVQLETLPVSDSLPGWVIEHGDPLIVPDLTFELRSVLANRNSLQAYVGVPMRSSGQVLGVLSVARAREQPQFKVEEVALLTTIADQVGVVVESARLRQLTEQSAVIAERARLARDLHDSVTQLLYSVNLFAGVGREAFNLGDMAQVNSCLAEMGQIAQQALKEMRLLVYELRPLALTQDGLVGALRQRLDAVERRTGIQAQLQAKAMLDLPRQVEEALYHIAQEALNNALKHAAATAVTVSIGANNGRIELEVVDNGSGFDPQGVEGKGGLGLTSMRERVEKMGGVLTILSMPGEGTKVKVSLEV